MFKIYTQEIAENLAKSLEGFEMKATEKDYIIKDVVMTSNDTDRHNEVVLQDGADLASFEKNPVALIDHNYVLESIAGVWENLRKEDGKLIGDCRLVDTPAGNLVRKLHESGAVKDVSIGFIAKEKQGNVISKWELIECSFVVVGSNRSAKIKEALGVEYQTFRDAGLLGDLSDTPVEYVEMKQAEFQNMISEFICETRKNFETLIPLMARMVDDKTVNQDKLERKEQIQGAVRLLNDVLRDIKKL